MTSSRERTWTIESNKRKIRFLNMAIALVGLLLIALAQKTASADNNALAAFWAGVLLCGLGVAVYFLDEKVTLLIDESSATILVRRQNRISRGSTIVRFEEIERVEVVKVGKQHSGAPSFHLKLKLRNGKAITTGRWSFDLHEINSVAEELATALGCECKAATPFRPLNAEQALIAAFGSVAIYGVWYRIVVGPWCAAMWFGTAPPLIMLVAFTGILGLLQVTGYKSR